jgi:hypothetical protein
MSLPRASSVVHSLDSKSYGMHTVLHKRCRSFISDSEVRSLPLTTFITADLTCSVAILLAHATKPLSLCFNELTVDSLLRLILPAVGLLNRLSRRSGVSDLTSRILQWLNPANPSARDTAPSHSETSQLEPPTTQDVQPDAPRYEWLWLKTKRIFVKAFLNVLRRQIRTVSLPSWALDLSIRRSPAISSGLTAIAFAAGLPHLRSLISVLTIPRDVCWLGYSSYPSPA